jgi:hypothetical protein
LPVKNPNFASACVRWAGASGGSIEPWQRRTLRGGYAFAQGAHLHGASPERHWVWESRRAMLWGLYLPLICITSGIVLGPWGAAIGVIYPLQIARQSLRNSGSVRERMTLALFQVLGRFPEAVGQLTFFRDRWLARPGALIEYK